MFNNIIDQLLKEKYSYLWVNLIKKHVQEDTDWLQRAKKSKFKFSNSKMPIYYKGLYNITYFSIIQKWFRNYYASKNLPHLTNQKNFYLFISFVVGFVLF